MNWYAVKSSDGVILNSTWYEKALSAVLLREWMNMEFPGHIVVARDEEGNISAHICALIGLSLSMCICDILDRRIAEESVSRIIAATAARDEEDWQKVFTCYRKTYWQRNPDQGEAIARRLIGAGKVEQPRLEGRGFPNVSSGHWCMDASEVVYCS